MRKLKLLFCVVSVLAFMAISVSGSAVAGSTTKSLSTVYTLVNLGTAQASVQAQYSKAGLAGGKWDADPDKSSFTVEPDGGQAIIRQYFDNTLAAGNGSVVISSSQPLGGFVQILARGQTPSSGAYNGVTVGSTKSYLPTVQKGNMTGSGLVNSQIIIQNADATAQDVKITLTKLDGSTYTKDLTGLVAGASYYYDLADDASLAGPWVGAATIEATNGTGKLAVVSNMFVGPHGLMTYNGFPDEGKTTKWYIPFLSSRLGNGQSGVASIQNVSGTQIPANDVVLSCVPDANSTSQKTVLIKNATPIDDKMGYSFNPYTDTTNFDAEWYGSCSITSTHNIVAFGQIRYTNGTPFAAAYEGIPANSTGQTLYVPLIMKRLGNGQCTVVTIQNLNETTDATVKLTYTPSSEYVTAGGSSSVIEIPNVTITKGSSINRNYRLTSGAVTEPLLPPGWYGTLKVTSDQPVQAMIQISNLNSGGGDILMANLGFVK